jgi:two-component system, NtrC family, response regulator GlrR
MKRAARILVVDDEPEVVAMLSRSLARHGFQVVATSSAEDALARADAEPFDAALLDLVMPGRDGADLAGQLRKKIPGLPIGLLTGYSHSPLIPAFERSGMAVFKKPVIIQELVDFLQKEIGG